ncbi:MAG: helix-turn-helix transcriptional regulator [Gemmatimonadota bacterium]|jgi:DNA-binding PadR family transcriptional regulator
MADTFLAEFEMYVMLAVSRLGDDAYGVTIRREIEDRTGRPVSVGALYATLARLGRKGFLEFEESDPRPVPGGRSRKYCRPTDEGRAALSHSATMMTRMMEGLEIVAADGEGA